MSKQIWESTFENVFFDGPILINTYVGCWLGCLYDFQNIFYEGEILINT